MKCVARPGETLERGGRVPGRAPCFLAWRKGALGERMRRWGIVCYKPSSRARREMGVGSEVSKKQGSKGSKCGGSVTVVTPINDTVTTSHLQNRESSYC